MKGSQERSYSRQERSYSRQDTEGRTEAETMVQHCSLAYSQSFLSLLPRSRGGITTVDWASYITNQEDAPRTCIQVYLMGLFLN